MQLTIRMPDDQMGKIEHIAKKMGLKKSDVTRMALKKFIEEYSGSEVKPFDKVKNNIITFDQKDFNIYRLKKQPFVISP